MNSGNNESSDEMRVIEAKNSFLPRVRKASKKHGGSVDQWIEVYLVLFFSWLRFKIDHMLDISISGSFS